MSKISRKKATRPINKTPTKKIAVRKGINLSREGLLNNGLINKEKNKPSVTIITCTNRINYADNILQNFLRQNYKQKELIIILNNNSLNKEDWEKLTEGHDEIRIYQLDERISLGSCLNYGVSQSKGQILAKFDDDDYYGPMYLKSSVESLMSTKADVVGKSTSFVYFEFKKIIALRNLGKENKFVTRVEGPSLVIKREVFDKVIFPDKSLGEDIAFCKACIKEGFKIYSSDRYNHVYIRHKSKANHTWGINDELYLKLCHVIGTTDDYRPYADSKYSKV